MSDSGETRQWLKRLWRTFAAEPRNRQDLLQLLREARERGLFEADALTMIEGVLAVSDMHARDVMVPRAQMVCVQRDDPVAHILPVVVESGHSRFPVLDEDRDDIAGILLAKDLLRLCGNEEPQRFDIREYMRPAVFVPESKRLDVLLKEFRGNHQHMAIVIDEYGGVAGLITIEDVIEQIVGEIDDEFDVEDDQ
ncbi:magnesium and cobalt efflux protein CorC, partial [mine drainage metagenome]